MQNVECRVTKIMKLLKMLNALNKLTIFMLRRRSVSL